MLVDQHGRPLTRFEVEMLRRFEPYGEEEAVLKWSRMPFGLLSSDGQFRIVGPVDEPGFKGYKLLHGGEHVATKRLLRDAKAEAERLAAA